MNRTCAICVQPLAVALVATLAFAQAPAPGAPADAGTIPSSHLAAQIPKADLDRLLLRDLTAYFTKSSGAPATVSYELLRRGPTVAGVSSPKYYAWVTIGDPGTSTTRGAVRLEAVDRERFEVMEFFPVDQIRSNPAALESVFPKSVIARIDEKVRGSK